MCGGWGNCLIAVADPSPCNIETMCEKRITRLNEKSIEGIEMASMATKGIRSTWIYRIRMTNVMKQKNIYGYFEILVKL